MPMPSFETLCQSKAGHSLRVVLFDAVGTVLTLRRSVADCYHDIARDAGIELPKEVIRTRFPAAFARYFTPWQLQLPEEWLARELAWPENQEVVRNWLTSPSTSTAFSQFLALPINEALEVRAWASLVAEVLSPLDRPASDRDTKPVFQSLWHLFAEPQTWLAMDGASTLIARLRAAGIQVCLASNFDRRLHQIIQGFNGTLDFDHVFVSSDLGFRKPDPRFYRAILERLGIRADHVAMIGDRWWEDFAAPTVCGLQAYPC
jgi:putative hydrolase of the HAD superfamily